MLTVFRRPLSASCRKALAFLFERNSGYRSIALPEDARTSRSNRLLEGIGRLRPGVSYEQAAAELSGITTVLAEQYPASNRNTAPRLEPLRTGIGAPILGVVVALLGAVAFVLLIACANAANLLLARAAERMRDVAVRLALGASRWRIVRQLLVESLVLATVAGVLGLGLSYGSIQIFWSFAAQSAPPYWLRFPIDRAVFAYFAVICLGSSILCGLVPAWQASRSAIVATLNDMGRTSAGGRSGRRWTGAFVVAQVALALVLLTGATLMIQNLLNRMRADIGVDTDRLVQMELEPVDSYLRHARATLAVLQTTRRGAGVEWEHEGSPGEPCDHWLAPWSGDRSSKAGLRPTLERSRPSRC